jgi:chromosome segregation ATPase
MSEMNLEQRNGCGPRLVWIAKAAFTFLLVIGVIAAIAWGGYAIYQMVQTEVNRSSESVTTRFDAQESRIDILRQEVNALVSANPGQEEQLAQLTQQLTEVNQQLENLDEDLAAQDKVLAALEASMTTTLANDETAAGDIAVLGEGLTALQGDFNKASVRLDTFGGEVDALNEDVGLLGETAVSAQELANESETAVDNMAQTLMLYRAWGLVARARLRLLENNLGLAQADVEAADDVLQLLIAAMPEAAQQLDTLQTVQVRLALAAENLPIDSKIAGADLETAWDELDKVLTVRLQPFVEALEVNETAETSPSQNVETEAATPIPTTVVTPEPTATPSS